VKLVAAILVSATAVAAAVALPSARATAPRCRPGVLHAVGTPSVAFAAVAQRRRTPVYARPGKRLRTTFPRLNALGYPTTFSIIGAIVNAACDQTWYRVKLPMRPNGSIGYVRPAAVSVHRVATRIAVDLSRRTLELYRRGKLVLRTPVAVGSSASPTPIGRFYVDQRFRLTDPNGPYGPAALGVSAYSDVLTDWPGGGPIGIHGTNQPWTIGYAASHGCIRVPNATMRRLVAVAAGTPVVIHP
jgi:lipoprotein-anchoring transpeptidase ErfK/SrfK